MSIKILFVLIALTFVVLFVQDSAGQRKRTNKQTTVRPATQTNEQCKADGLKVEQKQCNLSLEQSPKIRGFQLGMSLSEIVSQLSPYWADIYTYGDYKLLKEYYSSNSDKMTEFYVMSHLGYSTSEEFFTKDKFKLCVPKVFDYNTNNYASLSPYPSPLKTAEYKDIASIKLVMVNNKLALYSIRYRNGGLWQNTGEFVSLVSKNLALPETWQEIISGNNDNKGRSPTKKDMSGYILIPVPSGVKSQSNCKYKTSCDSFNIVVSAGEIEVSSKNLEKEIEQSYEDCGVQREERKRQEIEERKKVFKP